MPNYTIKTKSLTANDYIKLGGAAIVAVGVVFGGWKLFRHLKNKRAENQELKQYGKEINKNNLSFTESEFMTMADRIKQALNSTVNDDEETVFEILKKLQNKDDWNKLVKVFGVQRRNMVLTLTPINGTLIDWFQDAFSSSELNKVKQILSAIGVTF